MSVSYNESVIHYILFNMELTATSRWEIGENAIDDIDDSNDNNDDHDLDAIDPTIYLSYLSNYPSITVIHLSLSVWYSHSCDVIPYRDAFNLSIISIVLLTWVLSSALIVALSTHLSINVYLSYLSI